MVRARATVNGRAETITLARPIQLYAWPGCNPTEIAPAGAYIDLYADVVGAYRQVEYKDLAAWVAVTDLAGAGIIPDEFVGATPIESNLSDVQTLGILRDLVLGDNALDKSNAALVKAATVILRGVGKSAKKVFQNASI